MFDPTQLDQINDVVQRTGFSDKRKRNEAIRAGMENPGAFQEQNQGVIQEAQQPSEFMGAGRKLAMNQNPDQGIASLFQGNLAKHGNEWYSYGDTDYSNAQFGTTGYTLKDIGYGKYDILDQNNNSLGTSYGPVRDAITAYANANINKAASSWTPTVRRDENGNELPWGASPHEQGQIDPYTTNPYLGQEVYVPPYNSELGNWEALGQMINGSSHSMGGYFPVGNGGVPYADTLARNPHNNTADLISGLNTLYGSTPLIMNNKLLGYKMDLGPGSDSSPFADQITKNSKKEQMNSALWRTLKDPEEWNKLGKRLGTSGEDFFVPTENAEKLPGWYNEDKWQYAKAPRVGGLSKALGAISPILKFTPLAPFGYFIDAAKGMESGNYGQSLAAIFGGTMGLSGSDMAGAAGVDQMPSGGFSGADLADFSSPTAVAREMFGNMSPSVTSGLLSALTSKSNPLLSGLGAAAGTMGSGMISSRLSEYGDTLSKIAGGAASTGIKSLFNQNQAIRGSEQTGRSGGLNALLNSTPSTNDVYQQTPEEQQQVKENLQRRAIQQVQLRQQGRI